MDDQLDAVANVLFANSTTTTTVTGRMMNSDRDTEDGEADNSENDNDNNSDTNINVDNNNDEGSTVIGAIFNFTNCIVGAGAIGLGGAIGRSGGFISIFCIVGFGILTKRSLDLVVALSLTTPGAKGSYEDLGRVALGNWGAAIIAISKFLYSFGCLVAYVVVVKDNMGPALSNLLQHQCNSRAVDHNSFNFILTAMDTTCHVLKNKIATTWIVCITIMLPLCLLRSIRPLSNLSALSISAIFAIVIIIVFLYWDNPDGAIRKNEMADQNDLLEEWINIRLPGFIECLGTFVFTFVSQHTVHLAFDSLKPSLRKTTVSSGNMDISIAMSNWKKVSFWSVTISATFSLTIGLGVYMSFGQDAKSDIFEIYPQIPLIDVAKLLLSITMVLTFPMPFFTCRELLVVNIFPYRKTQQEQQEENEQQRMMMHSSSSLNNNNNDHDHDGDDDGNHNKNNNASDKLLAQGVVLLSTEYNNSNLLMTMNDNDLEEPLLQTNSPSDYNCGQDNDDNNDRSNNNARQKDNDEAATDADEEPDLSRLQSTAAAAGAALNWCLLPGDPKQLKLPIHVIITIKLWLIVVVLAISAPSLGDVLDLVGCATGTIIAFIVPACISFQLTGYTLEAILLLVVGGVVGVVGTFYSLSQIAHDIGLL
eukprot:CAMPEP_0198141794 /NCGR_PEP_ID=MMETSP1443-20131203/4727_1 /TAXON_ID=186043 /ORGANISM="Entomoneis sp., Strain CCMP2396" /LENGTH=647 /DNA_ID=CAMNT_0043804637 /DNA_START=317 /DNA_END=2260 /DNA_ORIENTATION=+